jgi:hypothetical protein
LTLLVLGWAFGVLSHVDKDPEKRETLRKMAQEMSALRKLRSSHHAGNP